MSNDKSRTYSAKDVEVQFQGKTLKDFHAPTAFIEIAPATTGPRRVPVDAAPSVEFLPFTFKLKGIDVLETERHAYMQRPSHFEQIVITFEVIAVETGKPIELYLHKNFHPWPVEDKALTALHVYEAVLAAATHEVKESLFSHGEHIQDPHPEQRRYRFQPLQPTYGAPPIERDE